MAIKVTRWECADGSVFDTEAQAELHEQKEMLVNQIRMIILDQVGGSYDELDIVAHRIAELVQNEIAKRDYYWSVTNNDD